MSYSAQQPVRKHFLDTSVARLELGGTTELYREYLESLLPAERRYVSAFIKMELRRNYLFNLVDLYWVLKCPTIHTLDDLYQFWSHRYQSSAQVLALQIAQKLFSEAQGLDPHDPQQKQVAIWALEQMLARFEGQLRNAWLDIGRRTARCVRGDVTLNVDLSDPKRGLDEFRRRFRDTKACRAGCSIDEFLLKQHRATVDRWVRDAKTGARSGNRKGYVEIASHLDEIVSAGPDACVTSRNFGREIHETMAAR